MSDMMMEEVEIEIVDREEDVQEVADQADFTLFLDKAAQKKFENYIHQELEQAYSEREPLFNKLSVWRKMADNENMSSREPAWEGASDINVPVIPIMLKTASSRLRNTFNARKPFWSIKALNNEPGNEWIEKSSVLEKYFNIMSESRYDLNMYAQNNRIMTDLPIAGTVFVKVPWTKLERNVTMAGVDEAGQPVGDVTKIQVIHNGPEVIPFRAEDVLFRTSFQDLQKAPWCAFTHHLDWYEVILERDNSGWMNVDRLENNGRPYQLDHEAIDSRNRNENTHFDDSESSNIWDIDEVWAYYDVDGDGICEDIYAYYHRNTQTLLAVDYNRLGVRPIRAIPCYMRPWSMEGQGLVELSEDMQEEINALHNMRNDGIHLTESAQFAVRRGSGIRPKEKVKPGKVWFLDDPTTDIRLLQTSKSYVETANLESLDYSYLERVTGIQDIAGGFSSTLLKSRDSASSQSLRLQAGSEVFHGIVEGISLAYQDIAEMIFRQLVANKEVVMEKERLAKRLTPEELVILNSILDYDINQIPYILSFKARLVDEAETYEARRQGILSLVAIYQQFAQGILPLIQQTYGDVDPMILKAFMGKFVSGATHLMEKVFTFFGEGDPDDYIVTADKVQTLNAVLLALAGQRSIFAGIVGDTNGQVQQPGPAGPPNPAGFGGGRPGAGQGIPQGPIGPPQQQGLQPGQNDGRPTGV
jgi:hypothetical protein